MCVVVIVVVVIVVVVVVVAAVVVVVVVVVVESEWVVGWGGIGLRCRRFSWLQGRIGMELVGILA